MKKITLLMLFVCGIANADEKLIEHIPKSASDDVVIAVVRQALIGRQWEVKEATSRYVSASITKSHIRADIIVTHDGQSLRYEGYSVMNASVGNPASTWTGTAPVKRSIPSSWIKNLRHDIGQMFATIPDR